MVITKMMAKSTKMKECTGELCPGRPQKAAAVFFNPAKENFFTTVSQKNTWVDELIFAKVNRRPHQNKYEGFNHKMKTIGKLQKQKGQIRVCLKTNPCSSGTTSCGQMRPIRKRIYFFNFLNVGFMRTRTLMFVFVFWSGYKPAHHQTP